jgi:hypothetical protein
VENLPFLRPAADFTIRDVFDSKKAVNMRRGCDERRTDERREETTCCCPKSTPKNNSNNIFGIKSVFIKNRVNCEEEEEWGWTDGQQGNEIIAANKTKSKKKDNKLSPFCPLYDKLLRFSSYSFDLLLFLE